MPITLHCPACAQAIKVRDEMAGKRARCPACKHVFPVPPAVADITASPPLPLESAPPSAEIAVGQPPIPPYAAAYPPLPSDPLPLHVHAGQPVLPWVLFAATLAVLIGVLGLLSVDRVARGDTARGNALVLAVLWIVQMIVVPMIGGFFLWLGCKLTKIAAPYLRCWLAYLAAYAAASCICLPLCFLMPRVSGVPGTAAWLLILGIAIGIHWAVVPLVLRAGFVRSLLAQSFGILMTATLVVLLSIPVILNLRAHAHVVMDMNSLREIGLAMHRFEQEHQRLPAHAIYDKDKKKPLLSWRVMLLPYLEQNELYRQFRLDEPWDSEHNMQLLSRMPKVYAAAANGEGQQTTHFQVFTSAFPHKTGTLTPFPRTHMVSMRREQFRDGPSQTLMIAEATHAVPWTKPDDMEFTPDGPLPAIGQPGKRFIGALYFDNSVRPISAKVPPEILGRLIMHNDGQDIPFQVVDP